MAVDPRLKGDYELARRPAVFIDRDGVLNHVVVDPRSEHGESPLSVSDVEIVLGAGEAISRLRAAGWLVICITNQPAAAKGSISLDNS